MDYLSKNKLQREIISAYESHDKSKDELVMWGVNTDISQELDGLREDHTPLEFVAKIIKSSDGDIIVVQIGEIEIRQFVYNLQSRFSCQHEVVFQIGKLIIPKEDYVWIDEIINKKEKQERITRVADIAMGNYMKEVIDFYD